MNSAIRRRMYLSLVFALLCLTFLGCAAQTTQPKITSGKTEVELRRERKARADEEKKAKQVVAAQAKREAAAIAKAERAEKDRYAK